MSDREITTFLRKATRVATKLFAKRGYSGVTMRSIASALGVNTMTGYRYFENEAEIFALVRADAKRRFMDAQRALLEHSTQPLERLVGMCEHYVRFALGNPDGYHIMFEIRAADEPQVPEGEATSQETQRVMLRLGEALH